MISASASSAVGQLGAAAVAERRGGLVAALALAAQHGELVARALLRVLLQLGEHQPQRADAVLLARLHRGREVLLHPVGQRHLPFKDTRCAGRRPWPGCDRGSAHDVHAHARRDLRERPRGEARRPSVLLGRLLGDERAADGRRAEDAERLGRDLRRRADDRERCGAIGAPEGERRERLGRDVRRPDAVAGVAERRVRAAARQRGDERQVRRRDVDRPAPRALDRSPGERREEATRSAFARPITSGSTSIRPPVARPWPSARRPSRTGSGRPGWCAGSAAACARR